MNEVIRKSVSVSGVAPPAGHYSHAVAADARQLLFVAGQVPVDVEGNLVAEGDIEAQARQVFFNLQQVLQASGTSFEAVVKTSVFLTDLAYRGAVNEVRRQYFTDPPPANTLLVVSGLANPAFMVEVEAIAVF